MDRYSRHIVLSEIGQTGQKKLGDAKVLVVGAGGLGCPVLQYLTAAGVGTIGIIDFDLVEESNLQRQVLFGSASLGMNKAIAAKMRLEDLNHTIDFKIFPEQLTSENALSLFEQFDIIVDGTDNFGTRYLINDAALISNKPVVYGAIYKFEGQVSVFNYQNGPSYRCLFPNPPEAGSIPNCSEIGVLGVLPGIIGAMQANEVLKIILEFDSILSGHMLCYDSKSGETMNLKIKRSSSEIEKVLSHSNTLDPNNYDIQCKSVELEISASEALLLNNVQFIDVRKAHEQPKLNLTNCIEIPLNQLENEIQNIDTQKTSVVFCQSGVRSLTALSLLKKHNITNCKSLKGGISALLEHTKIEI